MFGPWMEKGKTNIWQGKTKEQEETIEKLTNGEKIDFNTLIRKFKREGIENFAVTKKEYIETVLNMLKDLQRENKSLTQTNKSYKGMIKKKDKIIDLMAEFIDTELSSKRLGIILNKNVEPLKSYKKDIKQYFERKANNERN